jgi:2-oxoisovalerate dehydrogenase E1 component
MYEDKRAEVLELAEEVSQLPQLSNPAAVMEPITDALAEAATTTSAGATRTAAEEYGEPLTLARAINRALSDVLTEYPGAMVFGEDVARKGGVYGVTRGLLKKAGPLRVFDTVLDEQAILGLALGSNAT